MASFRSSSTLLVLALVGCESKINDRNFASELAKSADGGEMGRMMAPAAAAARPAELSSASMAGAVAMMGGIQPSANSAPAVPLGISRKIIYDAQVDVIVDSVDPVSRKVGTLVQDARGYIAEQSVTGSPGSLRSMRWRIRVPVESFESLVNSVISLGELERNSRTSQDVTEQYYDIEARIKNKKIEEQTLNKILQERSGKLEDVLKVEVELSRVRGETEQLEGKIRVLENMSSLATLTLNIHERDKYAPPAPVVADFPTQIARAWEGSFKSLQELGKSIVLWIVTWAIWIPLYVIAAFVAWIVLRWVFRVALRNRARLVALATTPIGAGGAPRAGV
jgi:Domain of unknown function (DUF4349)